MDIIQYLLSIIQYLYQQNCWLINFICRYIPLKQWAFDDSHSPKYQKFKVDELPNVQIIQHEWDWRLLIPYFEHRYNVKIKPVARRKECDIPQDCSCPSCGAPQPFFTAITAGPGSLNARFAILIFRRRITALPSTSPSGVPIAVRRWSQRKNASILSSTNVSTPSALTISTT